MAMPVEEENFIRIFKLVSGVAPKAVREKFDKYFPPVSLTAILKQEEPKLKALHTKKRLTATQIALLFPTSGLTSSSSYDVTLMICLLRNLTTLCHPVNGFDVLPPSTEIHDGADLARVKFYRNKIAHSEIDRLPTSEFTTVWNDLEQALVRLGGSNVKAICDDIKQAILTHDILLEVHKDISQFREDIYIQLEKIHFNVVTLDNQMTAVQAWKQETTAQVTEVQKWNQETTAQITEVQAWKQETTAQITEVQTWKQETTAQITEVQAWKQETTAQITEVQTWKQETTAQITEVQAWKQETTARMEEFAFTSGGIKRKFEECSCHDFHEQVIQEWEQADEIFVTTHVVDVILEKLQSNHCITVTGSPGMGKSSIIHHVALLLHKIQGYIIVPCTNPDEIKCHFKKDHLQVFVFYDVCGRYSINHSDVGEWVKMEPNIVRILNNKKTKVLSSCRLQIFFEKQFQDINLLKECSINLTSDENSLTASEKIQIALKYLDKDIVDRCNDILKKCDFLPLMCYLCKQTSPTNVQDFLSNPFDIYAKELNSMKNQLDNTKWCVLFLITLHNGQIKDSFFWA